MCIVSRQLPYSVMDLGRIAIGLLRCGLCLSPVDIPAHAASIPTPRRTFPSTEGTIAVFADPLASDMSEAQYRFAATHFSGTLSSICPSARPAKRCRTASARCTMPLRACTDGHTITAWC
jgi:hypothetical protein